MLDLYLNMGSEDYMINSPRMRESGLLSWDMLS